MIKITVLQLIQAAPVLQLIHNFPHRGEAKLHVRRLIQKVNPELANAGDARDSLMNDANSTVDKKTLQRSVKPRCIPAFLADPLFANVIEIDVDPLTYADLADDPISDAQLTLLGPLFVDE